MTSELSTFAAHVGEFIAASVPAASSCTKPKEDSPLAACHSSLATRHASLIFEPPHVGCYDEEFSPLALELFALQFAHNAPYRKFCEARRVTPRTLRLWSQIP